MAARSPEAHFSGDLTPSYGVRAGGHFDAISQGTVGPRWPL